MKILNQAAVIISIAFLAVVTLEVVGVLLSGKAYAYYLSTLPLDEATAIVFERLNTEYPGVFNDITRLEVQNEIITYIDMGAGDITDVERVILNFNSSRQLGILSIFVTVAAIIILSTKLLYEGYQQDRLAGRRQ